MKLPYLIGLVLFASASGICSDGHLYSNTEIRYWVHRQDNYIELGDPVNLAGGATTIHAVTLSSHCPHRLQRFAMFTEEFSIRHRAFRVRDFSYFIPGGNA